MIVIVDYGMGNLQSVQNGFARMGYSTRVTGDIREIKEARGIILPGVGAFGQAVKNLNQGRLGEVVKEQAREGIPLLGICLGLQLLFERSQEGTGKKGEGLGLVSGEVVKFQGSLKVPHMGWNRLKLKKEDPLFYGIEDQDYFYFVHSYYAVPQKQESVLGAVHYGTDFAAVVKEEPCVYGVQFHPEKSSDSGLKILANFGDIIDRS